MKKVIMVALFAFFLVSPALVFASSPKLFNFDVFFSKQKQLELQDTVTMESHQIHSEADYERFIQKRYDHFFKLFFSDPSTKEPTRQTTMKVLRLFPKLKIDYFQMYLLFLHRTLEQVRREHPEIASKRVNSARMIRGELLTLWEVSAIVEHTRD